MLSALREGWGGAVTEPLGSLNCSSPFEPLCETSIKGDYVYV